MPLRAALAKLVLAGQRIGGEQDTLHAERLDQGLHGWDLVGGIAHLLMRQDQGRLAGEGAQHVRGSPVVQMVEAALERLAVERHDAWLAGWRPAAQLPGMLAQGSLQLGRIERLKQSAQGIDGRGPAQRGAEHRVEALTMHGDEDQDAALGGGACQDGQHRKQQQVGERVALPLASTRVRDLFQRGEQASERHHGGLQHRCGAGQRHTRADDPSPANPPSPIAQARTEQPCLSLTVLSVANAVAQDQTPSPEGQAHWLFIPIVT